MRELLVEVGAQPGELVRLAERGRLDDLVEVGAVGVVELAVGDVVAGPGTPDRITGGLGVVLAELEAAGVEALHVAGVGLVLAGTVAHLGPLHALGERRVGVAGLAFVQGALVALALGVVIVGLVVLRVGLLVGEPEGAQELAQRLCVGLLVVHAAR